MSGFFTPVPLDFDQAFRNGGLTPRAYLLGCHLAAESFRAANTDAGLVTFHVSPFADLCAVTPQTVRQWLHELERKGWIECAVKERQRSPWRIKLTGLRKPDENASATPLQHQPPSLMLQSIATSPTPRDGATPLPERGSATSSLQPSRARAKTKRDEREPLSDEGNYHHLLGKTTEADFDRDGTDRMLAALAALDDDGPLVSVDVDEEGLLVWSGEPQEGEQGFLDDCHALVDAGIATWLEGSA